MIIITGTIPVDGSKTDAIREACNTAREATLQEDGCANYRFAISTDDPNTLIVTEEWRDEDALAAHGKSPALAALGKAMGDFVTGRPELYRIDGGTKGPLRLG
jgi:quinol monooxygenase YgiN